MAACEADGTEHYGRSESVLDSRRTLLRWEQDARQGRAEILERLAVRSLPQHSAPNPVTSLLEDWQWTYSLATEESVSESCKDVVRPLHH